MMTDRFVAVLLLCSAALGCRDGTAPLGELTVAGAPAAGIASRSSVWGTFVVDVTLRNATSSAIRVGGCGPAAEREVTSGHWETALEPICSLNGPGGDVDLPPGAEQSDHAVITGSLSAGAGPQLLGGVLAGRYRLVYRYWTVGVWGQAQEARSAAFDVTA
jgi:hypothetical protein